MTRSKAQKKHTKATYLLTPMLGYSFKYYKDTLVNTYIGDYEDELALFIVLNRGAEAYHQVQLELRTSPYFIISGSHKEDDGKALMIFKAPLEYKEDLLKFLEGKYSKFSQAYKDRIYNCLSSSATAITKVINPTDKDRRNLAEGLGLDIDDLPEGAEIVSKPDISEFINLSDYF